MPGYRKTVLALSLLALASCDDFLTRVPKDELTPEKYFTTETECRLYTNEFYTILPEGSAIYTEDADYIIPLGLSNEVIGNRTVPATSSAWNWDKLRDINFFIEHSVPFIAGTGRHFFQSAHSENHWTLASLKSYPNGVFRSIYTLDE